ncbi:MAG TPA: hypothetical protein PK156_49250, partial [Polyangium sp.]|nr:hypothetical protein [Polyangium sp.]
RQISNLWATLGKLAGATPIQVGTTKVDFDLFGKEGPCRRRVRFARIRTWRLGISGPSRRIFAAVFGCASST